jgi:CCR4-NOT transcriptional regulation complex NOT5 subunit
VTAAGYFSKGGEKTMSQIQPEGEEIRKAIKWISANLEEGKKRSKLIEEAAIKFDLSPAQTDFLVNFFSKKQG